MDIGTVAFLINQWQEEGLKVVLITGTFDLYHPGHVEFIEKSKTHGDKVVVGISNDAFTKKRKGADRPFIPEAGRLLQVESNRNVDAAFITYTGKWELINSLKPNVVLFNTTDTQEKYKTQHTKKMKTFRKTFRNVTFVEYSEPRGGYSTTALATKIRVSTI